MKSKEYLVSSKPFPGGKAYWISWGLILLWLATVLVVAYHHEMWRDEVRALSLAISADSIFQLPQAIKNEGHPLLWYLVLWVGYSLTHMSMIMQITSITFGLASILIFFRAAPMPNWWKILFIFSLLPIYEYTVMARSYGLSMLLLFAFAAVYTQPRKRILLLACILFALANSNIHSAILTSLLAFFWISEEFSASGSILPVIKKLFPALVIILLGLLVCYITTQPDKSYADKLLVNVKATTSVYGIFTTIVNPGKNYHEILPLLPDFVTTLVLLILSMGLLVQPIAAFCVFAGVTSFSYFFGSVYGGSLRHEGLIILFILTMYWLIYSNSSSYNFHHLFRKIHSFSLYILLPLIFLIHIYGSYKYIRFDLTSPMSSSKSFGKFLSSDNRYVNAIILAEPETNIESLPYYAPNRIYMPHASRFENVARRTRQTKKELTMSELLDAANLLKEKEKAPVLIALGHFDLARQEPPLVRNLPYKRKFTWTAEELSTFQAATVKIAEFKDDYRNERYEIYELQ